LLGLLLELLLELRPGLLLDESQLDRDDQLLPEEEPKPETSADPEDELQDGLEELLEELELRWAEDRMLSSRLCCELERLPWKERSAEMKPSTSCALELEVDDDELDTVISFIEVDTGWESLGETLVMRRHFYPSFWIVGSIFGRVNG